MAFFLYPTKEDGSPASWRTIMIGVWVLTLATVSTHWLAGLVADVGLLRQ